MEKCNLVIKDQCNVKFEGLDPLTRKKLSEALKFMVPHARYTPQYRLKRWDGKVAFATLGGATYLNLLDRVLPLVIDAGYEVELVDQRPDFLVTFPEVTDELVADRAWPAGHVMAGEPIMLRDYQVEAIQRYFDNPQSLQSIVTGAGKTLLTACLSLCVEMATGGKSIVIVPSKSLVIQTEEDYRNLGLDVGVFYGDRKEWRQHTICTWQSLSVLVKDNKAYFEASINGVNCVIVDEVHSVRGQNLRDLLCGPLAHVPIRWGLTGTIPKEDYEFMSLLSSLGPVVGEIKASELQEKGVLANCDIEIIELQDDHVAFGDYDSEYRFLTTDRERLFWVAEYVNVLAENSGNTLILVERRETGYMLENFLPGSMFVYGDTKTEDRRAEYNSVQTSNNKIIIATYGVASTGINIPRLFNIVCFQAGKSFTRVIQSAGRGLRLAHDKVSVRIVDITSSLKFSRRHLTKRKEYYRDAGYPFTMMKVDYR